MAMVGDFKELAEPVGTMSDEAIGYLADLVAQGDPEAFVRLLGIPV